MQTWLIGAGPMASFHADVLSAMKIDTTIVATSATRAKPLAEAKNMAYLVGGLAKTLSEQSAPEAAIIALPVDLLANAALELLEAGTKRILLEKPGALNSTELQKVSDLAEKKGAQVFIAYNRRFFASVIEARRRIDASEGVLSFSFEFCENSPRIAELLTADHIKQKWFLANSTHVVDLAFHLGGWPTELSAQVSGQLPWHSAAADFRGLGISEKGANFSYFADWRGPGRWGIEIVLPSERLILRPMEKLARMPSGSFSELQIEIDDDKDVEFKPGLYCQLEAFYASTPSKDLVSIMQQFNATQSVYNVIANYKEDA
ncbi:Gfo/Idh/MocA family oxidoreductase [Cognatishimia sp. 1_MG-2023]|uniref:Gfo/Idh/MocA family protein n=1 Tax=Cognatishimia sp. 1_MG-2023 TaxID=3062642 RepID=UPI0026E22803|nr:Gfo/Idh/MocA family oxidoreductase [Cognatishimia sp. 1_MG-2023]MDO6728350.1 Gfo/Idh/MocA family oxidoreductase [Cognatishimia sp. 1_MG-2023]